MLDNQPIDITKQRNTQMTFQRTLSSFEVFEEGPTYRKLTPHQQDTVDALCAEYGLHRISVLASLRYEVWPQSTAAYRWEGLLVGKLPLGVYGAIDALGRIYT